MSMHETVHMHFAQASLNRKHSETAALSLTKLTALHAYINSTISYTNTYIKHPESSPHELENVC